MNCVAILIVQPVYPRVGGGNNSFAQYLVVLAGLSPRGRGKRLKSVATGVNGGSIPAWAGETSDIDGFLSPGGVYPRVGGGNS